MWTEAQESKGLVQDHPRGQEQPGVVPKMSPTQAWLCGTPQRSPTRGFLTAEGPTSCPLPGQGLPLPERSLSCDTGLLSSWDDLRSLLWAGGGLWGLPEPSTGDKSCPAHLQIFISALTARVAHPQGFPNALPGVGLPKMWWQNKHPVGESSLLVFHSWCSMPPRATVGSTHFCFAGRGGKHQADA